MIGDVSLSLDSDSTEAGADIRLDDEKKTVWTLLEAKSDSVKPEVGQDEVGISRG